MICKLCNGTKRVYDEHGAAVSCARCARRDKRRARQKARMDLLRGQREGTRVDSGPGQTVQSEEE